MRGLLLLSGGFDSPVAGLLSRQHGVEIIALHYNAYPFFGQESTLKAELLAKKIGAIHLFVCDIAPVLKAFVDKADRRYYFVFMKRVFLRIAEQIAQRENCSLLITGENLGQVSSQTLSTMGVIATATAWPVARPLLGLDKQQIVDLSKKLETHDLSVGPEMCDALGPKKPVTQTTLQRIRIQEKKIALDELIAQAVQNTQKIF